jgi:hypothetical protein
LVILVWHLLSRGEDYAFMRPGLYREKLRRLELQLGAPRRQGRAITGREHLKTDQRRVEREAAAQFEAAYLRIVADWQASRPPNKAGVGATPGRASNRSSKDKAARQAP